MLMALICCTMSTSPTTFLRSACGTCCVSRCEGCVTMALEGVFWSCFCLASTWRVFGVCRFAGRWPWALSTKSIAGGNGNEAFQTTPKAAWFS
jgi:hypothetical protein